MHIREIKLITSENIKNSFSNIAASIQLSYELTHFVYNDLEGRFIEDRKKSSPMIITVNPYQSDPVFLVDLKINNEEFTVGINPIKQWYTNLKIERIETISTIQEYELKFDIESHHVKEITAPPNCT